MLSGAAQTRLAERPTVDPQAYEAVLRGQFHLRRYTREDFMTALQYFESALAIDSGYAPAHVGIAGVWASRAQINLIPSAEARRFAEPHVAKALQLDPQLAQAQFLKAGLLVWGDWDLEAGQTAFRRALELDSNDAQIQVLYGHVLAILGRWEEAVEHGERAMVLDPLNAFVQGLHGSLLVFVGRTEEAIDVLEDMIERHPGVAFGVDMLGDAYSAEGRHEEALEVFRKIYSSLGQHDVADALDGGLQAGDYAAGCKRAADQVTARPRPGPFMGPWIVAHLYSCAGESEAAIDWLEVAAEQRNQNMPYMGVMPAFWTLHEHPRFQRLAQEVGVPLRKPAGQ